MKIELEARILKTIRHVDWCCDNASRQLALGADGTVRLDMAALRPAISYCPWCGQKIEVGDA